MHERADMFVDIFPNTHSLWGLCGYIFLVGISLSSFSYVFWGWEPSGPFVGCVLQDIRTVLSEGVCPRVWGLCCVCGCGSQYVSSLNSVGVCTRKWNTWSVCEYMRSQSCLSLCMSQYRRSVFMSIDQGYQFFDNFVLALPREWGLWAIWSGGNIMWVLKYVCGCMTQHIGLWTLWVFMFHGLKSLSSLLMYIARSEVSDLFVVIY